MAPRLHGRILSNLLGYLLEMDGYDTTTSGRDDDEAGLVVENQRLQFSVFDEGTMDETLGMA